MAPTCAWCERVIERPFIHLEEVGIPLPSGGTTYEERFMCSHAHLVKWLYQLFADLEREQEDA